MRPVLGPLPHPLLRAHHSLLHLLCPLQPLLLPLLSADEDACGGHSSRDDGSNDAPDDATCGPCACCVGCLCKKRDSVRESPGGSHSALFPAPPPKSPPTCLPLFPRAEDILFIHLILNDHLLCDRVNKTYKSPSHLGLMFCWAGRTPVEKYTQ